MRAPSPEHDVSRAWVHRLIQRRRETESLTPRKQAEFRRRVVTAHEEERLATLIAARPDATLTELRVANRGRAQHAVADDQPLGRQYVFLGECGVTTDRLRRYGR